MPDENRSRIDQPALPAVVLGADWAAGASKRSVWMADVGGRTIRRCDPLGGWTLRRLLDDAAELSASPVTLAEMYPRVTYTVATAPTTPPARIRKGDGNSRREWIEALSRASWISDHGVQFSDLPFAHASEDDFDALFATAALLRRVLEGVPLGGPSSIDPIAEGGILLSDTIAIPRGRSPADAGRRHRLRTI